VFPVHCCHSSLPGGMRRPHILRSVEELRVICRVFRAGGSWNVAICCGAGLVALRRFGVSVWFALVRFGVTRRPSRIVPRWHGMTRRECAAMRRYTSGRGARYGSLWFGRRGSGVRRFASPSPAGGGTGPDMARILPGVPVGEYRTVSVLCLAMSRYVAPPARAITRAGDRPAWSDIVPAGRGHPHLSRQYSIVCLKASRVTAPARPSSIPAPGRST